jgi:BirA family transcriptional regulator, biotin operon repressor / biotin---[acetyl-CoA-carboxylase] ligase
MDLNDLKNKLKGLPITDIHYFPSTGSTNEDALNWASQGAKDGSLVIADQQTSGRGRLGRKWVTNPGSALAFTLILRLTKNEIDHLPLFSPMGALAVSEAIRHHYQLQVQMKWPNDVLINRKKVCGILAESQWSESTHTGLVLGIGINISPESIPDRTELLFPATCLENECGYVIDRDNFLRAVLDEFFQLRPKLGSTEYIQLWQEQLAFKNEMVQIENPEKPIVEGILKGIDEKGNLLLLLADGRVAAFSIGDVKLRPQ